MKIGRNDDCPCGSGKKYKNCCLGVANPLVSISPSDDPDAAMKFSTYKSLRRDLDELSGHILEYAIQVFGKRAFESAVDELFMWEDVDVEEGEALQMALVHFEAPFFLHQWTGDEEDINKGAPIGVTPSSDFKSSKAARKLSTAQRDFLEAVVKNPFSFFEVKEAKPGVGVTFQEFFTEQDYFVYEVNGSRRARIGDILFARLVEHQGICLFDGTGPFVMPKEMKLRLIDLKHAMLGDDLEKLSWHEVVEWKHDLQEQYCEFMLDCLNPRPPQMCNRDGDTINLQTLHFEIKDPHEAAHALKVLCKHRDSDDEMSDGTKLSEGGHIVSCQIGWSKLDKEHGNTSLGSISIDKNKMSVFVNSDNRASTIKDLIGKLLPDSRYKTTAFETSTEGLMDRAKREEGHSKSNFIDPEKHPEVKVALMAHLEKHWDGWIDHPLPALGGQSPREAVKTKPGREKVIALIESFETNDAPGMPKYDYGKIRRKLELDEISV